MPRSQPGNDTRQNILDTAARLFARDGLAATSMRDIARECGLKASSLYNHFESKERLALEIFDLGISNVSGMVVEAMARTGRAADFRSLLHAAILAHLEAFFVYGDYTATNIRNFKQAPEDIRARSIEARDAYERIWQGLLEKGRASGALAPDVDLDLARRLIIGAMNWTLEWFRPSGKHSLNDVADMVERMFLQGLATPHEVRWAAKVTS